MSVIGFSPSSIACGHALGSAAIVLFGLVTPVSAALDIPSSGRQGETLQARLVRSRTQNNRPLPVFSFKGRAYPVFALSPSGAETDNQHAKYSSFLPVPATLPPGRYRVDFGLESATVTILPGRFPVQKICLPKGKDNFEASPGEMEAVDRAKATLSPHRMWRGAFSQPVKSRVSTVFGVRRFVNGKLLPDYFHSGIDYAAASGAPVKACAAGRVVLSSGGFKLHGNTIAIDHGQGVVSFYIHLNRRLIQAGDEVKEGQIIGRVGQTGRANGPHLHFSIYVDQVATNPIFWFQKVF